VTPPPPVKFNQHGKEAEQKKKGRRHDDKNEEKRDEKKDEKKDGEVKWQFLISIEDMGKVSHLCAQDGHVVAVGAGGRLKWICVSKEPIEIKKVKRKKGEKKNKKKKRKFRDDDKNDESEDGKAGANLHCVSRVVCELALNVPHVTTMHYRSDGLELLVGSSNGTIFTIKVNQSSMEPQLRATSPDLLPPLTSMERRAEIEWESEFHDGAIFAIGFLRWYAHILTS
jgi:hypothetical protein